MNVGRWIADVNLFIYNYNNKQSSTDGGGTRIRLPALEVLRRQVCQFVSKIAIIKCTATGCQLAVKPLLNAV